MPTQGLIPEVAEHGDELAADAQGGRAFCVRAEHGPGAVAPKEDVPVAARGAMRLFAPSQLSLAGWEARDSMRVRLCHVFASRPISIHNSWHGRLATCYRNRWRSRK